MNADGTGEIIEPKIQLEKEIESDMKPRTLSSEKQSKYKINIPLDTSQPDLCDKKQYTGHGSEHTLNQHRSEMTLNLLPTTKMKKIPVSFGYSPTNLSGSLATLRRGSCSENHHHYPKGMSPASSIPTLSSNSVLTRLSRQNSLSEMITPIDKIDIFLPYTIVFISKQPYWAAIHQCISMLYDEIKQNQAQINSQEFKQIIQQYAYRLCNTPTPPTISNRISLSLTISTTQYVQITLDPSSAYDRPVLDLDLSTLLTTLNIGNITIILAALMTQQPIVFFSQSYAQLVTNLECLLYCFYPLKWLHVYVPLLPSSLLEIYFDQGPVGCYIMGCHSKHQQIIDNLQTCMTCNLDTDQILIPDILEFRPIPSQKLTSFIEQMTQTTDEIKQRTDVNGFQSPMKMRMNDLREYERLLRTRNNETISMTFLELMVDIFGDTLNCIRIVKEKSSKTSPDSTMLNANQKQRDPVRLPVEPGDVFLKSQYLKTKNESEIEFYTLLIESSAFHTFIGEQYESLVSTHRSNIFRELWKSRREILHDQLFDINKGDDWNRNQILSPRQLSPSVIIHLPLPDWTSSNQCYYIDSCIDRFTQELEAAKIEMPQVLSNYYYLRGCCYIAQNRLLDGLQDFYSITNPQLFPGKYIESDVLNHLSEEDLKTFYDKEIYTKCEQWKKIKFTVDQLSTVELSGYQSPLEEEQNDWYVSDEFVTCEQFSERVQRLGIVADQETTMRLFNALLHWNEEKQITSIKKEDKIALKKAESFDTQTVTKKWTAHSTLKESVALLTSSRKQTKTSDQPLRLPGTLFDLFLDIWQRKYDERERMRKCLPNDNRNLEMILKVSSSGSKTHLGVGYLILTQKRLYFLPETRHQCVLLTDIEDIILIEKFQHSSVFSADKPGIKIMIWQHVVSKDDTLTPSAPNLKEQTLKLIMKDDRDLWYTLINELWSGFKIAREQFDHLIKQKASTNILLMDVLSEITYDHKNFKQHKNHLHPQAKNSHISELACNELCVYTSMKEGGYKCLTQETRNALTYRIQPSLRERDKKSIESLVFVDDEEYPSLWCAYGTKLKVYDAQTWLCDKIKYPFSSEIKCLCLDIVKMNLWVGSENGELFVVDTLTRTVLTKLTSVAVTCQSLTYDVLTNQMITGYKTGQIVIWDTNTWGQIHEFDVRQLCFPDPVFKTEQENGLKTF
ncbi:unnamed protein product [Didymodactylos carnosus]|uniref:UDENN domain-containing protein n=2 Tax=Didymodactylos carnosus TaxID=1234261 RepID=A0A8S2DLC6_9BILA|nr:unnamed protein product [Didymodactylos carnosus]CAF3769580.1 unnamed protein product [Didymodactylos carnosus]